jgi:hypothetical protein
VDAQGDFYTLQEAARVLNRTPGQMRQMLDDGILGIEGGEDAKETRGTFIGGRYTPSEPHEPSHTNPPARR